MTVEQKDQELLEEAIAHLDFDPTCEAQTVYTIVLFGSVIPIAAKSCGQKAVWISVCRTCAMSSLWCDQCYERAHGVDVVAQCPRCMTTGPVQDVFVTSRLPGGRS